MDKRYQIFISSTFKDLIEERQAALRAILELNQMPAGMELFPAGDDGAWQLITDVIDASDYYVLIIGGRYGSLDETGIGYTEKEYEYAVSTGKHVIPLLHKKPDNLPRDKTETDEATWKKLQEFRQRVEGRHTCVYWESAEQLQARLIVGLTSEMKRHPATGWVRADQSPSPVLLQELLAAKKRVEELESQVTAERTGPPPGTEQLQQGDDTFDVAIRFTARDEGERVGGTRYKATISPTWNEIFAAVAPSLLGEAPHNALLAGLHATFVGIARTVFEDDDDLDGKVLVNFKVDNDDLDTCVVQLRALGLVEEGKRKRSVRDTATYWKLTPYGDALMVRLRALTHTPPPPPVLGEKASEQAADGAGKSK